MKKGFFGECPEKKPPPELNALAKPSVDGAGGDQPRAPRVALTAADFDFDVLLGEGSFSQVIKANRRGTNEWYAMKVMDKRRIVREKKVEYVKVERIILDRLDHPGVVRLHFTMQDAASLYMGMEVCEHGEMHSQIRRKGKIPVDEARQYFAEILDILQYVHSQGCIHRDVKPENLLVGDDGHLKLCDFGSAKVMDDQASMIEGVDKADGSGKKKGSFVGTAEYVSPEVLDGEKLTRWCVPFLASRFFRKVSNAWHLLQGLPFGYCRVRRWGKHTHSVDFWAAGCVLFQMLVGKPPFRGETEYLTFQKVMNMEIHPWPEDIDADAKDLILKLLVKNPDERLGAGKQGQEAIRAHPFFKDYKWDHVREQPAVVHAPPPAGGSDYGDQELDALEGEDDFLHYHPRGAVLQNGSDSGGLQDGSAFIARPGELGMGMRSLAEALPGDGQHASVDLNSSDED